MFVDIVSSEYDLNSLEEFGDVVSKWNHHHVRQVSEDLLCSTILERSLAESFWRWLTY